jgi:hypothetical protein
MGRLIIVLCGGLLLAASSVTAQGTSEAVVAGETSAAESTAAAEATATEAALAEASKAEVSVAYEDSGATEEASDADEDCTGVYCKKVKGILWVEGTAGPARFNVTRFRSFNLLPDDIGQLQPNVTVSGGEYGAAIGAQFDIFSIGGRFKYGKFGAFDLITAGIDFGFVMRFVPYVAPYARFGLNYNTTKGGSPIPGLDQILEDHKVRGGGVSIGAGVRVPIIKWISVAVGFDYSFIALYVTGYNPAIDEDFGNGTIGGEIAGTFALTFHPI